MDHDDPCRLTPEEERRAALIRAASLGMTLQEKHLLYVLDTIEDKHGPPCLAEIALMMVWPHRQTAKLMRGLVARGLVVVGRQRRAQFYELHGRVTRRTVYRLDWTVVGCRTPRVWVPPAPGWN